MAEVAGILVKDVFPARPNRGGTIVPGMVAVLDGYHPVDPQSYVGRMTAIRTVGGSVRSARIGAVRDHGKTISFFYEGLEPAAVAVGSYIAIEG